MKTHPETMLLIEKQDAVRWRVVNRLTRPKGLSNQFQEVARDLNNYRAAREAFDIHKGRRKPEGMRL